VGEAAPVTPTATPDSAAAAQSTHSRDVGATMLQHNMSTTAERQTAPLNPAQKQDLSDPQARTDLLRASSQVNPVSRKAGNDGLICGGAATTGALVESAKTPEQAKANAKAVDQTAKDLGVKPSPQEQAAIKAMGDNKMSATDVQHMQQLNYRMAQQAAPSDGGPDGVGPRQMGALASHLKGNGAFGDSDVKFNMTTTQIDGKPVNHWTSTTDNKHYNSVNPSEQHRDKALVLGGPPGSVTERGENWQAEVRVGNDNVTTDYRSGDPGHTNESARSTSDLGKMKSMSGQERREYLNSPMGELLEQRGGAIRYRPIGE